MRKNLGRTNLLDLLRQLAGRRQNKDLGITGFQKEVYDHMENDAHYTTVDLPSLSVDALKSRDGERRSLTSTGLRPKDYKRLINELSNNISALHNRLDSTLLNSRWLFET